MYRVIGVITVLMCSTAYAGDVRVYDSKGATVGIIRQGPGNETRFYDKTGGIFMGSSRPGASKDTTIYYDQHNMRAGSTQKR